MGVPRRRRETSPRRCAAFGGANCRILPLSGNAGSFFKNPVVDACGADRAALALPGVPVYPASTDAERKLSAAWLIEQAGWRGFREGDAGISAQHALVLVNHGRATGAHLLALARRVVASVQEHFGVALEPEPRIVGATSDAGRSAACAFHGLPGAGVRHARPGLGRRQRRALLQQLDRDVVRRAHERHAAVARRTVDRDAVSTSRWHAA